jgi:hypothetical protein
VSEPKKNVRRAVQLPLPAATVKALLKAGIRCRPVVSLGYQNGAKRYVIRGVESGGAVSELGHYVAFCGLDGQALPWLQPAGLLVQFGGALAARRHFNSPPK